MTRPSRPIQEFYDFLSLTPTTTSCANIHFLSPSILAQLDFGTTCHTILLAPKNGMLKVEVEFDLCLEPERHPKLPVKTRFCVQVRSSDDHEDNENVYDE